MNLFSIVKTSISTIEVAERYGIEVNRHGKALCPFHNDQHPSLFVADNHYHCYACGEHGDSIDLVARLFGLPLYDAAKKLASDFGLAPDKPPNKEIQDKQRRNSEAQQLKENERLCFLYLNEYCKLLQSWKTVYSPPTPDAPVDRRFVEACHRLESVEYDLDLLISGDSYERAEIVQTMLADGKLQKLQAHLKKAQKEAYELG